MPLPIDSTPFSDSLVILGAAGLVIPAFARFRVNLEAEMAAWK